MEQDDLLDDLLSWTDKSPRKPGASGLQEGCVNTASTLPATAPCVPPPEEPKLELAQDVRDKLFDYQREGVEWLFRRHRIARACLLADEMGLGKTVQVCVFLNAMYQRKMIKTTIVVVPPTLIPMWTKTMEEWTSIAPLVEVIHGDTRAHRQTRWRKLSYGLPCILLTTYGVLRQDATSMASTLVDYVVLDEAHLIKDPKTGVFKSALTLSARHKIALTGTPLMNSFDDMWSIFRFLDGSIIDMKKSDFSTVSATLLRGNERDASAAQRTAAAAELCKLQTAIQPFMLRREKKDLVHAVDTQKRDLVVWVRMSAVQEAQYSAFLGTKEATEAMAATEPGANPLLLLTTLSQICNHPWLQLTDASYAEAIQHPHVAPLEEVGDAFAGSKMEVALHLIDECVKDTRKALVFSRSKRLLRLLGQLLKEKGVTHCHIDGDTNSDARFGLVNAFNTDETVRVCLLTTQVGGVGLTFTAAAAVLLLDPSWNPSADAQAVDRVHRIGQRRDVWVFRLVTCGTVEEKVYRNQVFKRMAAIQSTTAGDQQEALFRYFTRLELRSMFVLDELDSSTTATQLEALHPGRVETATRERLKLIPHVVDVSDNTCVLAEQVDATAAEESEARVATLSQESNGRSRLCSRSPTPPPLSASRPAKVSRVEVAAEVEYLLEELKGSSPAPSVEDVKAAAKGGAESLPERDERDGEADPSLEAIPMDEREEEEEMASLCSFDSAFASCRSSA